MFWRQYQDENSPAYARPSTAAPGHPRRPGRDRRPRRRQRGSPICTSSPARLHRRRRPRGAARIVAHLAASQTSAAVPAPLATLLLKTIRVTARPASALWQEPYRIGIGAHRRLVTVPNRQAQIFGLMRSRAVIAVWSSFTPCDAQSAASQVMIGERGYRACTWPPTHGGAWLRLPDQGW